MTSSSLKYRVVFLLLSITAVTYLIFFAFETGTFWFVSPDRTQFEVRGVDVSHHQGSIDWEKVHSDDVEFAWIKATEGGDWTDPMFEENWVAAQRAGVDVGAYHYFTFCRPAEEQAKHLLDTLDGREGALPVAVDVEYGGNCKTPPELAQILAELRTFVRFVQSATGHPPVLYAAGPFRLEIAKSKDFATNRLWIRSLFLEPSVEWTMWQFHSRGRVEGVMGPVDLNVFRGSRKSYEDFLISSNGHPTAGTRVGPTPIDSGD